MKARSVNVCITYKGKDISLDIAPFLTAFTFTDNSGKTADDISFSLMDRKGLWLDSWFPSKGDTVKCSIVADDNTAQSLPCGQYEVDQIDYSCPPRVMTIKAVSTAITKGMKNEKHNRTWENAGIKLIASDIANNNGLSLYFDGEDITLERREQIQQSDMEFLSDLCSDYGFQVKVNEGKLIIYDHELNDEKEAVAELKSDDPKIISWKFSTKASGIYKKAHVKYHNAAKNETFEAEEEDDSTEGTERIYEYSGYIETDGDAKALAKKMLYELNKQETSCTITLMGDMRFRAGVNVTLSGFGAFDGKYNISKVTHSVNNGYTTTIEIKQEPQSKKTAKKKKAKAQTPQMGYYTGDKYYSKE